MFTMHCGMNISNRRMPSSRMLHHVALVRADVSDERSISIIRRTRICELGTMLAVTSNRCRLPRNESSGRQIIQQVSSQSPPVGLCHEVH
jgi:hypothetical protein